MALIVGDLIQYVGPSGGGCDGVSVASIVSQASGFSGWSGQRGQAGTGSNGASGFSGWSGQRGATGTSANLTIPVTVGTPTTPDSSADVMFAGSATTKKVLVIQTKPSQTEHAFEIQDSTGTANVYYDPTIDNLYVQGSVTAGNVNANGLAGDGSGITNLQSANLVGDLPVLNGSNLGGLVKLSASSQIIAGNTVDDYLLKLWNQGSGPQGTLAFLNHDGGLVASVDQDGHIVAVSFAGDGSQLTNLPAPPISSGTASLGSGSVTISGPVVGTNAVASYLSPNGTLGFLQAVYSAPNLSIYSLNSDGSLNTSDNSAVNWIMF